MSRVVDGYAGVSWITSAIILLQSHVEAEFLNWLVKAVVAGAIAVIGYYLRDTAKTIQETKKEADRLKDIVGDHDTIIAIWAENLGRELDARNGNIGRRHSDMGLADLVTAMRKINERNGEGK